MENDVVRRAPLFAALDDDAASALRASMTQTTIGRGPDNGIMVDMDNVSRAHCKLYAGSGGHYVEDMGSTNGTFIDRVKVLEAKLGELLKFGEDNDAISEKVHRLAAGLVAARDFAAAAQALQFHLREDFAVPHAALRVWLGAADHPEFSPVSDAVQTFATELEHPFCGPNTGLEAVAWLGEAAPHVRSVAFMPLRDKSETFGLLLLASEDPQRFYGEMGTVYLSRIGDLVSAALMRFI